MNDWATYKVLLNERFEDVFDDPIAELKQLQETGEIGEYMRNLNWSRLEWLLWKILGQCLFSGIKNGYSNAY